MRDKETMIVISFLVALPLWLFGILPMANSGVEMNVTTLLAFLSGSVAAWVLGQVYAFFRRPRLVVSFVEERGCYVLTGRGNPPTHTARFFRLLLENRGRSSVKGCAGYITRLSKEDEGLHAKAQDEILNLTWAHSSAQPRDIPPGAFFHLDVVSLDCPHGIPSVLWLSTASVPNHVVPALSGKGRFKFNVRIVAENIAPIDGIVSFLFDPQKIDLLERAWRNYR